MQPVPLACFLSLIRPPGVQFETALLQAYSLDKSKCPFLLDGRDIDFQLYTRHNPSTPQSLLIDDDEALFASNIDFNDPTVVFFHAFMETPDDGSGLLIREAYMQRGDTNFIMVDAQRLEAGPWYFKAADNTWYIGRFAAKFIDYLVSRGLKLSNTHFVGHSLGAQSAGVAGSTLTSGRVSRITGLDPAWPVFCKLPLEQRLDESDAEFVDVIHTDAGIFGFKYAVGHVDFFPNGGKSPQPGCELEVTLPKQLLLNNCENATKTLCFYAFPIKENTHKQIDIRKTFEITRFVHALMNNLNVKNRIKTNPTKNGHKTKQNSLNIFKNKNTLKLTRTKKLQKRNTITTQSKHQQIGQDRNPEVKQLHRQRRFIPFLKSETTENENFLFRILEFFLKNRNSVVPIVTVMREINTLVKSANGELNHFIKERNNYIGTPPPLQSVSYNLQLDNNSKLKTFVKKLFGLRQGDNLTITTSKK